MRKVANFILVVMFLWFSELQLNDPDPIIWILIYGSMAVVCVMAAFSYYVRWLMIAQVIGYVVYCMILVPGLREWLNSPDRSLLFDDLAKMQHVYIEEAREFLGLVICLVVLAVQWFFSGRKVHKPR